MLALLNYEPEKRPTLAMLYRHPWVIKKHKAVDKKVKIVLDDIEIDNLEEYRRLAWNHYWGSPVKI
jgi:hypothetical protein